MPGVVASELETAYTRRKAGQLTDIDSGLFLGSGAAAADAGLLRQHGITAILNVADDVPRAAASDGLEYLCLHVADFGADAGISRVFEQAYSFVQHQLAGDGKVLVHCANGSNRSPTVVIALLMMLRGWSLATALTHVQCRRPVQPLADNRRELLAFELRRFGAASVEEGQGGELVALPIALPVATATATATAAAARVEAELAELADIYSSAGLCGRALFVELWPHCIAWLHVQVDEYPAVAPVLDKLAGTRYSPRVAAQLLSRMWAEGSLLVPFIAALAGEMRAHDEQQEAPPLLAEYRPASVQAAVETHRTDAAAFGPRAGLSPLRWERDAASNYTFGAFGDALHALDAAARLGRDVGVLDVGCGAGAWLVAAASSRPDGCRACGLTGGREAQHTAEAAPDTVVIDDRDDWMLDDSPVDDARVDSRVRVLHRFPIESAWFCDGFVGDGACRPPRFDLIVCSWTLRHCADPLGTIEQLCNLLHVGGVLLANQVWLSFDSAGSSRWDDLAAFRSAVDTLSDTADEAVAATRHARSGVAIELSVECDEPRREDGGGGSNSGDGDGGDGGDSGGGGGDGGDGGGGSGGGYETALRCTRLRAAPVRFDGVEFTGEVSGPMSADPTRSANVSLVGGPSYAVARYRLRRLSSVEKQ